MLFHSLFIFFPVTFLVIAVAMVTVHLVFEKRASQDNDRDLESLETADGSVPDRLLKSEELSSISIWHSVLAKFDAVEILKTQIAQSGLNWSVGRVTLGILLLSTLAFAVLVRVWFLPLWVVMGLSWFAGLCPYLFIRARRRRRFEKFREAFPDALDSLSRGLRAGYPLVAALDLVASETEAPVSTEVRKTFVEANLGMPWEQALNNLSERIPLPEVNLFVAAVRIHQRTGGRLSDVITKLTETMREQVALSGEVRALAAHGRITGLVLTMVPVGIAGMMMVVNPSYLQVLIGHPYGKDLVAAAIICLILAHFVMRRITDVSI